MALLKTLLVLFALFALIRAQTDSSDTATAATATSDSATDTGSDAATTDTNAATSADTATDTSDAGTTDTSSDAATTADTATDTSGTSGTETAPAQTISLADGDSYEVTVNVGDSVGFANNGSTTITITFSDSSIPPVVIPPGSTGQTIPFTTPGDYTFTVTESAKRSLVNRGKGPEGKKGKKGKKGKPGKGKSELAPNSGVIHVIGDTSADTSADTASASVTEPIGKVQSKSGSKNVLYFVDQPDAITHNEPSAAKQRAVSATAIGLLMGGVALVAGVVLAKKLSASERKPLLPK